MTEQKEALVVEAICTSLKTRPQEWKITDTFSPMNKPLQIYSRKDLEIRPAGGLILVKNKGQQILLSENSQIKLIEAIKKIESWALERELDSLLSEFDK